MTNHTLKSRAVSCSDPQQAAHELGQQYGVPELAAELNTPVGVLYNKLNPYSETNHLQLREAVFLTAKTDDNRILEAWCTARGGVFVPLPANVECDEELSDQLLTLNEQLGAALAEVKAARADGVITAQEFAVIATECSKTVRELLALKTVVQSQVRAI